MRTRFLIHPVWAPLFLVLMLLLACSPQEKKQANNEPKLPPAEPHFEYGIPTDSFHFCIAEVEPNENLSEILQGFDVPYAKIHEAAQNAEGVFDVRKIRQGNPYCIFNHPDSTGGAKFFVYEENPVDYVVFEFGDSVNVYRGEKEIEVRTRTASGIIESSLWNTMTDQDLDYSLIIKLSEIYAWSIDFYHLQKGDAFKVIFEEKYVEGERVGVGRVNGALFEHGEKDFYAIWFKQDTVGDYFDEEAQAMRRAFLKAPLKYSRISSRYNPRRFHPILKRTKPHLGTDYAAPTGTPIMAVANGTVVRKGYTRGNGNFVKIKHNGTYSTQYLHMSKFGPGIKNGVFVTQGQVIGYVGSTGLATGPHLCYRFWKNGKQVDPLKEEFPPAEPVKPEYLEAYQAVRDSLKPMIDGIEYPEEQEQQSEQEEADSVPGAAPEAVSGAVSVNRGVFALQTC